MNSLILFYCRCKGSFYGNHCEIDGEVMAVAVGASVAAVIIIILTLICLCMWRYLIDVPLIFILFEFLVNFRLKFHISF